ncbi:hypothetical protein DLM75_23205 [Leptospira stimsonii]|uniref:Uncharacterized protein n=1 Tax=Leptospira stimsonii TaxID=2202203 RepID=A0A396YSE2_9LEPT|nr:hypothetical protein DLM75_23205 [Leptospira stimsonii]
MIGNLLFQRIETLFLFAERSIQFIEYTERPFFENESKIRRHLIPLFLILLCACQKILIEEGDEEFFSLPIKESIQPIFCGFQQAEKKRN